jgi:ADP-ribose pyrophosphatase
MRDAPDWVNLGSYILDPNRGIASMHLYLALNARQVTQPDSDDLEDQELVSLSKTELANALRMAEFKVFAWSAVVAMGLNYLNAKEK